MMAHATVLRMARSSPAVGFHEYTTCVAVFSFSCFTLLSGFILVRSVPDLPDLWFFFFFQKQQKKQNNPRWLMVHHTREYCHIVT